jgi:hypothetical protein
MNCIAQLRHVDMKILRSTSPRPATVSLLYVDHSFGCCIYLIPKQKIHGSLLTGRFSQGQGRFGQNWRSSVPIHHAKLTRVFLAVSSPATRSLAFYKRPRPLTRERERELAGRRRGRARRKRELCCRAWNSRGGGACTTTATSRRGSPTTPSRRAAARAG